MGLFTDPLPRNGRPIVSRYAFEGTYLPSRWLATALHVTVLKQEKTKNLDLFLK
jgi:hypothetical protein